MPTNEQLKQALDLAVCMLSRYETGDSRTVSNEFVALAAVSCGMVDDEVMKVINEALVAMAKAG